CDSCIQYRVLDRPALACACVDRAFEMTRLPNALLYCAISEKSIQHYQNAAKLLTRALRLGLDTFDVHLELGNLQLGMKEFLRARQEYEKCLKTNPDSPIANFNHGLALRKMGDLGGAAKFYQRALESDSTFREPALELAVLHIQSNEPHEALKLLRNLTDVDATVLSLI